MVVGVLILFVGVGAPTTFLFVVLLFVWCGVWGVVVEATPHFLCVYGALAVKGSQRHACR